MPRTKMPGTNQSAIAMAIEVKSQLSRKVMGGLSGARCVGRFVATCGYGAESCLAVREFAGRALAVPPGPRSFDRLCPNWAHIFPMGGVCEELKDGEVPTRLMEAGAT